MIATALRSDLEIPQPLAKFLSLYLLLAIGFKGGVELAHSGLTAEVARTLMAAIGMAVVTPVAACLLLRRRFGGANAAGSAVTFIAAIALLDALGIAFSGYRVAALALMESPAIIVAVALFRLVRRSTGSSSHTWTGRAHEALLNGSVFLLVWIETICPWLMHRIRCRPKARHAPR